jgi:hypothetical protein
LQGRSVPGNFPTSRPRLGRFLSQTLSFSLPLFPIGGDLSDILPKCPPSAPSTSSYLSHILPKSPRVLHRSIPIYQTFSEISAEWLIANWL